MTPIQAITEIVRAYEKQAQWADGAADAATKIGEPEAAKNFNAVMLRQALVANFIRLEMKRLAGIDIP
jgi:hypothetical protein